MNQTPSDRKITSEKEVDLLRPSSVVFVGRLPDNIFDERDLFDGQVDPEHRVRVNSVVRCTYASGKYELHATLERVDIIANDPEIIPEPLLEAAQSVAKEIDAVRKVVPVSGIGMNCDTILPRHLISESGERYCASLVKPQLKSLVGDESLSTMTRVQFNREPFRYDVRIEPHFLSEGEHLYVAVNGYQALGRTDLLESALEHIDAFREYVKDLHRRVMAHEIE